MTLHAGVMVGEVNLSILLYAADIVLVLPTREKSPEYVWCSW